MQRSIRATVNGRVYLELVEPRMLLVHFLRDRLRLTGTHVGCDTTNCGACTVLLNDRAVKSCTILAVRADGAKITTIEGLAANGSLHPLQQAFQEHHALQCGFCTPGLIMASVQLLADEPHPTEDQVRRGIIGNICRCTGYQGIVQAIFSVARQQDHACKGDRRGGAPR